ncbi:MAG: glycosyl hydrolase [Patescibacteria group bacterium]
MPSDTKQKVTRLIILAVLLLSLPVALYLIPQATNFFNKASGVNAALVIDAAVDFGEKPGVWKNLAQGGEEQGRSLAPVVADIKPLAPRYIRIDHIYDFHNVVRSNGGQITYDFSSLDQTVNDILSSGAKPFFSLSYMPSVLSKSNETDIPNNWGDWENLVQATIEHYSGRGGMNISNVYYEVWNEPDLFGGFKTYGGKNYLDLYYHSAIAAQRVRNANVFKFGGPATTSLYENWVTKLLEYVDQNNLRLDFYSWHRYTTDLDEIEKDVFKARELIANSTNHANAELIITEIGHNSKNDKGYDTYFGAIHTLATSALLEDQIGKAFNFEIKDGPGPEKLWGRWGILTHEKYGTPEKKPRYSAFAFLNRITGSGISTQGQGSWVKAFSKYDKKQNRIKTLVVNYDPKGSHSEATPITYNNLPFSNFTFRRTDYSGKVTDRKATATNGSFSSLELMDPNTAAIFELIGLQ